MTREEASKIIKDGLEDMSLDYIDIEQYEALTMAIKALEQEPSGDLIRRQAVIDVIKSMSNANPSYWNKCDVVDREDLIDEISELPSVKQEPKTGHWIYDDECHEHGHCSECGYGRVDLVNGEPHNFCRRCGARMVDPQESEDKG